MVSSQFNAQIFNLRSKLCICCNQTTRLFEYQYLLKQSIDVLLFLQRNGQPGIKSWDYCFYLGMVRHVQPSVNLSRPARGVFGSFEWYSQINCSSQWNISQFTRKQGSFFPNSIQKYSSGRWKYSLPIGLQLYLIISTSRRKRWISYILT